MHAIDKSQAPIRTTITEHQVGCGWLTIVSAHAGNGACLQWWSAGWSRATMTVSSGLHCYCLCNSMTVLYNFITDLYIWETLMTQACSSSGSCQMYSKLQADRALTKQLCVICYMQQPIEKSEALESILQPCSNLVRQSLQGHHKPSDAPMHASTACLHAAS